jgi:hypothetical protein
MRIRIRLALRVAVILAVAAALQISVAVHASRSSPYASALSSLTSGQAFAAGGCSFRQCLFRGERLYCNDTTNAMKCAQHGTNCTDSAC